MMPEAQENAPLSYVEVTEQKRLNEAREQGIPWKKWGPYLSERQWGTVREDYSHDGNAWDYFSHDQSRSRAYHWGEDGLAGISDDKQQLCFALALWNERDPILQDRLFGGLTLLASRLKLPRQINFAESPGCDWMARTGPAH